ncbi:hypothetical protein PtA15_17A178 [Puccinia triticina]|uniref:Uncharacterized protein n=1 Tax=Puccinia triticina TaxID=208348 RepID=A0ABY7D8P5_9BASI|nr:uncharacterized protein PtA15_17A178 [Puccinia triticina]WAQ92696.1 hypothetical protein PtA15_17A178 [Puccinia triticina]
MTGRLGWRFSGCPLLSREADVIAAKNSVPKEKIGVDPQAAAMRRAELGLGLILKPRSFVISSPTHALLPRPFDKLLQNNSS